MINNNKFIISTILLLLSLIFIKAQEKTGVAVLRFTHSKSTDTELVESIEEEVVNALIQTKHFRIVDRAKMNAIKNERELQKSEDFINSKVIAQGRSLGATYLVVGHVMSASADEVNVSGSMISKKSETTANINSTSYVAEISVSLKVIDVETAEIIAAETLDPKTGIGKTILGSVGLTKSSKESSINSAVKHLKAKIDDFVQNNFPIKFSLVSIEDKDKDGNATKVLIAGGSSYDLKKGNKLRVAVNVPLVVDNKKMIRKKNIGEIKIDLVEDENFSVCSVISGGKEITENVDSNGKLIVLTQNN